MRNWLALSAVIFIAFVWYPVERAFSEFCFNNYDLGIYAQALNLLSLKNLNPWLSSREVFLFNDHFDPILLVAAPLRYLTHPATAAIRVEMVAALVAACAPVWMARQKLIRIELAMLSALTLLFSPMTLDALYFPAHPGTWAMAPLAWMLAFLTASRFGRAFGMLLILMACKEEFPVVGFITGIVLTGFRVRRYGALFVTVSALWALFVFKIRPIILGPSDMYTSAVASAQGVTQLTSWADLAPVLKRLVYIAAPGALTWILWGRQRIADRRLFYLVVYPLAAMIAIRFLGGYWGNHRSASLAVMAAFLPLALAGNRPLPTLGYRPALWVCLLVLLAQPLDAGSRWIRGVPFKKHCPADPGRLSAIHEAVSAIRDSGSQSVLAQGNLVPALADLSQVAQIGATTTKRFDWIITEKADYRNTWPLSGELYEEQVRGWRALSGARVVIDNDHVTLLRLEEN